MNKRLSNCCGAKVEDDSDICSDPKCGEHCALVCPECDGEGEVMDAYQSPMRIDPKYNKCRNCGGTGEIEAL